MTLIPILGVICVILISDFRIAQNTNGELYSRLGRFNSIKGPGLYWIIPLIDHKKKVDIRTNFVDLEQQETITKDSVTIKGECSSMV